MKKLTKPETAKVIKVLAKALNYPQLKDNHRYVATSKFGEILLSLDLNSEIPTIYSRLRDFSKVINKEECIKRDFSQYSAKRNYHCFPQNIINLVEEFKYDIMMDKREILSDEGER